MKPSCIFPQPLATGYDKFIGATLYDGNLPMKFESYFNQATPENAGKWGSVEPSRDSYSWSALDQIYAYCVKRGIPFKDHCLLWGQQQPGWIGSLDSASQAQEIEEYIRLVGQRYPKMYGIDVVNEGLPGHNPATQYMKALGGAGQTGYDWIIKGFQLARQYCAPGVKLILNDYGIINDNGATTSYLKIINLLKDRGLIDGIGVQGHRFELENTPTTVIKGNLDRLWATGIPIFITEFDVAPKNSTDEVTQTNEMERIFPVLWAHPGVKGITFWGYLPGTWQAGAQLLNADGSERMAMQWLRNYLTPPGSLRSYQSGMWSDLSTWEQFDGVEWTTPAVSAPSVDSKIVTVKSGDSITVAASGSINQVWISEGSSLIINPDASLTVTKGDPLDVNGTDMYVVGTVKCYGVLTAAENASICFGKGGTYAHERNGGSIPKAAWNDGSTCLLEALTNTAPSNGNQNFDNITWNSPGQTDNLSLGWSGNTINGNITVKGTGSGAWQLCNPALGENAIVSFHGDFIQSGGQVVDGLKGFG